MFVLDEKFDNIIFCHFLPPKNAVFSDPPRPGAYFAKTEVPPQFWQSNNSYVHWILPQYFLQDLWFKGGAYFARTEVPPQFWQSNLETSPQEEAKYFRYVIVWSMICELQVFNYCNSGKHWGFYCKVSLMKPFVVSTCRRRNGFNLSHGISLVLDSDQSERLIMAEQRVWYSRNFLWLREVGCKELNTCSLISYFSGTERWKSERLVWCFSMRVPGMWKQTPAWPVYNETKWKWCCLWRRGEGESMSISRSEILRKKAEDQTLKSCPL